jgi:ribosomal protein S18 acetylase RimI-like enzyme
LSDRFAITRLGQDHDRSSFSCGVPPLDRYLKEQAGQDVRRRLANCFVAVRAGTSEVGGFYTLSATAINASWVSEAFRRRFPAYPVLPATLIGRLAVDQRFRSQRLGEALLFDAIARASASDPASFAVVVDAKDDAAAGFYLRYDFRPISNTPRAFFLPIAYFQK